MLEGHQPFLVTDAQLRHREAHTREALFRLGGLDTGLVEARKAFGGFLTLAIAGLVLSRTVSPVTAADGSPIPLFQPDLWSFWMPFLIAVLAVEAVVGVVRVRGLGGAVDELLHLVDDRAARLG